ncbi:hypothetical protein OAQ99_02425 [Candidatus Kapabacteria bacterium]|nr:hypothetical protein [Candidatus Kapabacteria bacterium]
MKLIFKIVLILNGSLLFGQQNPALVLETDSSSVVLTNSDILNNDAWIISFWIKPFKAGNIIASNQVLVAGVTKIEDFWRVELEPNGDITFNYLEDLFGSSLGKSKTIKSNIQFGLWNHITISYEASSNTDVLFSVSSNLSSP